MHYKVLGAHNSGGPWITLAEWYDSWVVFGDVTLRQWQSQYPHLHWVQEWEAK